MKNLFKKIGQVFTKIGLLFLKTGQFVFRNPPVSQVLGVAALGFFMAAVAAWLYSTQKLDSWSDDPPWTLLPAIAAVPSLILTWVWRKKAKDLEIQTERFMRAIEQLGHDKLAVRLGGIHALGKLGQRYPDDYDVVVNTLCMFVRDQFIEDPQQPELEDFVYVTADVQACLITLKELYATSFLNLSWTYLVNGDLRGATLKGTHLRGANLGKAILSSANLEGANLIETKLIEANLEMANLKGANLTDADLKGANLNRADLRMAILRNTRCDEKTILPDGYICEGRVVRKVKKPAP